MSVRSTVTSQFQQVAIEQERALAPLSDDLKLAQSGLDSLSFAIIVVRLEDALGIDPYVNNLTAGTWYFAIVAVTNTGAQSARPNVVTKTIG